MCITCSMRVLCVCAMYVKIAQYMFKLGAAFKTFYDPNHNNFEQGSRPPDSTFPSASMRATCAYARSYSRATRAPTGAGPSPPTHRSNFSPKFEFWATSKFFQPHARPPDPTLVGVMICSKGRPLVQAYCVAKSRIGFSLGHEWLT